MEPIAVPTPTAYAVRLHASFEEIFDSGFVGYCVRIFDTVIIYEHIGSITEKVHCHFLLFDRRESLMTSDNIKKTSKEFKSLKLKGNEQLSFKTNFKNKKTKVKYFITEETVPKYITYMTKGSLEPNYVSRDSYWSHDECVERIAHWVIPEIGRDQKLYDQFCQYLLERPYIFHEKLNPDPYNWVIKHVNCFIRAGGVFNMKARMNRYMLVGTYLHDYAIPVPLLKKSYD